MIVKKLYRKVKCSLWNKKRNTYEVTTVTDYIGWFLFGVIPIYLIELNKYTKVDFEETGEDVLEYGIFKKYRHLLIKGE